MKLRTLSVACILGASAGLAAMAIYGVVGWRSVSGELADVERMSSLRHRISRLNLAIDYINLLDHDPEILRAIRDDALEIRERLEALDDPKTAVASAHLLEIASMSADFHELLAAGSARTAEETLERQFRIHQAGATDAMEQALAARQTAIRETLTEAVVGFGAGALLFASLCLVAFARIHRRLSRPLRAFQRSLEALASGDLETRVRIRGDDELADLAEQFNETVERLQRATASRDEAFAALEREQAMLKRTEGIARIGSWEWDLATDRITWSDQMYRICGLDPADPPPSFDEHRALFPEPDFDHLRTLVDRAIREAASYEVELRIRREDGSLGYGLARGEVETDAAGRRVRLVGSFQDVTERRRAQEEAETLRRQLDQASRLEAIGRLAGGVAHDFNNMLTVIRGHAELLLEDLGTEDRSRTDLERVIDATERSQRLTEHLLAFAREQPIAPELVDLAEVVEGMLPMLRRLIGEDVEIVWRRAPEPATVVLDRSHAGQILTNLCVNARDAIEGTGKVTLATRTVATAPAESAPDGPERWVMLSVCDDGVGMDPATLGQVFDPFFTTKPTGEGTGLGLATVYGIVKQNEGSIRARSTPGEGTGFEILLPWHEPDGRTEQPEAEAGALPSGTETVLVVEDQEAIRHLCRNVLERLGYTVLAAAGPAEALRLAHEENGRIDLVVSDLVMPKMNGRELADRLHSLQPELPVLFISGYQLEAPSGRGTGDHPVLQKPFTPGDLAVAVRSALAEP